MKLRSENRRKGFTLIELLVVIAIIGTLSTIVFASLNNGRVKSRDARRLSDIRQINLAMQQYLLDNSDNAPVNSGWLGSGPSSGLSSLVSSGYFSSLPNDPSHSGSNFYNYYYRNIAGNYICAGDSNDRTFCVRFRTESDTALGPAGNYCLTSQGIHRAGSLPGESATASDGFTPNCLQR